jgi:hypothetical protein
LGPHDEVPVEALALLVVALELAVVAAVLLLLAGALLELLLLLLPHPARNKSPKHDSNTKNGRTRDRW